MTATKLARKSCPFKPLLWARSLGQRQPQYQVPADRENRSERLVGLLVNWFRV